MGKLVGLVGSITNKIGTFVFSTWKGIQVARAYQPNVSNPKSTGQIAQRTKFDYVVQYSIAMNRLPFMKHLWSLITPQQRSAINEFTSRNLKSATFETDSTLCSNKLILADNNDYIQNLVFPGNQFCADGIWTLDGLDVCGCGVEPDGVILVQVFQSNLLVDPDQSPFRDARMCEAYSQEVVWPIVALANTAQYEDVFDICCPSCALASSTCCDAALWVIPVWSDGVDASLDPTLITKVGLPILVCDPECECGDPIFSLAGGYYLGTQSLSLSTTNPLCDIFYTITSQAGGAPADPPDPTSGDTKYTVPIDLIEGTPSIFYKIKAIAIGSGCDDSAIVNDQWEIDR